MIFDILDYRIANRVYVGDPKYAEFCYFLHKILAYVKKKQ